MVLPADESCQLGKDGTLRYVASIAAALSLLVVVLPAQAANWREYGRQQAALAGWTGAQWTALDAIVTPESGWDPCARFPSRHECSYAGGNSCGIPQRNPCPTAWRGRLGSSGREQVKELLRYVRVTYRDPLGALAFRRVHGWY